MLRPRPIAALLALAWLVVPATSARAQATAPVLQTSARTEVYVDDDATAVVRPRVSARVPLTERWEVMPTFTVDAVSTASVDIVSSASQRVREVRYEPTVTATRYGEAGSTLAVTYGYGHERDYQSHQGTLSVGRDLGGERLWHVQGRVQLVHGIVGSVGDPRFERHATTAYAASSLARIVGPRTVLRLGMELAHVHGFQSSAYRAVRIGPWTATRNADDDPAAGTWSFSGVTQTVLERHPNDRFRARGSFDVVHGFAGPWALFANLACYRDTYAVSAAEGTAELRFEPATRRLLRIGARVYAQSAAWFFRARYATGEGVDGYVTDDKELGPMRSYTVHAALGTPLGETLRLDLRVEGTRYRYLSNTLLPAKDALVVQVGLTYRR